MTAQDKDIIMRSFRFRLEALNRSPHTVRQYTDCAKWFGEWLGERPYHEATEDDVTSYLSDLRRRGMRPGTVRHRFTGLQAFYKWLSARDYFPNPMRNIPAPTVPEVKRKVVTVDEVRTVLTTLDQRRAKKRREFPHRNAAIISLLFDTGIRASELVAIKVEHVNWEERSITLPQTKNNEVRTVWFGPKTADRLSTMLSRRTEPSEWLFMGFQGRLTRSGLQRLLRLAFAEHGIEGVSPHVFRHSFATAFMENPEARTEDLMTLAGWKRPEMAARYTKSRKEARARASHLKNSPMNRV